MKKLFVIFAAIAMVGAFTATAMAADWAFYGSARVETSYNVQDEELSGTDDGITIFNTDLNSTSRVGANVKVSDALSGRFEYGYGPNLRLLYGVWNFGSGALIVGQTYTPGGGMTNGNQALFGDYGMYTFGLYESRQPQITLSFGSFSVGIVQNGLTADLVGNEGPDEDWTNADLGALDTYPTLEAGYNGSFGNFSLGVYGGVQTLDIQAIDETHTAYGAGVSFGGNFGAVNFTLQGSYSINGGSIWIGHRTAEVVGTDLEDVSTMNATGSVGFTASEMIYVEGGLGFRSWDSDAYADADDDMIYYVQCKINLSDGVFVVPEVSVLDLGDDSDGVDQGSAMAVGAKWQINF